MIKKILFLKNIHFCAQPCLLQRSKQMIRRRNMPLIHVKYRYFHFSPSFDNDINLCVLHTRLFQQMFVYENDKRHGKTHVSANFRSNKFIFGKVHRVVQVALIFLSCPKIFLPFFGKVVLFYFFTNFLIPLFWFMYVCMCVRKNCESK